MGCRCSLWIADINESMTERDMSDLERFIVREKDCTRCDTQIRAILVGFFAFADV